MKNIAVFCGSSSGNNVAFEEIAYQVGQYLAEHNLGLVYGGGSKGLMGAVAKGALENGGNAMGVITTSLAQKEGIHPLLQEIHLVQTMHYRKQLMSNAADAFLILPGGFGTMDEFFEVLTWKQIGLHDKPIIILNTNQYWDALLELYGAIIENGFAAPQQLIIVINDIKELMPIFLPQGFL